MFWTPRIMWSYYQMVIWSRSPQFSSCCNHEFMISWFWPELLDVIYGKVCMVWSGLGLVCVLVPWLCLSNREFIHCCNMFKSRLCHAANENLDWYTLGDNQTCLSQAQSSISDSYQRSGGGLESMTWCSTAFDILIIIMLSIFSMIRHSIQIHSKCLPLLQLFDFIFFAMAAKEAIGLKPEATETKGTAGQYEVLQEQGIEDCVDKQRIWASWVLRCVQPPMGGADRGGEDVLGRMVVSQAEAPREWRGDGRDPRRSSPRAWSWSVDIFTQPGPLTAWSIQPTLIAYLHCIVGKGSWHNDFRCPRELSNGSVRLVAWGQAIGHPEYEWPMDVSSTWRPSCFLVSCLQTYSVTETLFIKSNIPVPQDWNSLAIYIGKTHVTYHIT